jgi:hypothetical protein
MNTQLIDRKEFLFRAGNCEYYFVKPYYLMPAGEFRLLKAVLKGSTICWNIQGKTISYNQIRKIFISETNENS